MRLKKIKTPADISVIKKYFHKIFPEEPHYDLVDFENSITGKHKYHQLDYFLAYDKNTVVGFCGIYSENMTECWLGWFGIRPEYRRKGYASGMLSRLFKKMIIKKYQICRVYTDKVINHNAYLMYQKYGFVEDAIYRNDFVTMTKILDNKIKAKKWKGVPLGFESETPHHFDKSHKTAK